MFNGKITKYAKNTYNDVRKNLWSDSKNVFKYMFPLHFFQTHYLPSIAKGIPYAKDMPVAAVRMTQSALVNNPIYRIIMSTQKKDKMQGKIFPSYNYSQNYA